MTVPVETPFSVIPLPELPITTLSMTLVLSAPMVIRTPSPELPSTVDPLAPKPIQLLRTILPSLVSAVEASIPAYTFLLSLMLFAATRKYGEEEARHRLPAKLLLVAAMVFGVWLVS